MNIDEEFKLLREYMCVYIQLLPQCYELGGTKIPKRDLPSFDEFKENYEAYTTPAFKQSFGADGLKIFRNYTLGLGTSDGIAYRYHNYYKSAVYYPNNLFGDYTITEELSTHLKALDIPTSRSPEIKKVESPAKPRTIYHEGQLGKSGSIIITK